MAHSINILHLEDVQTDAELVERTLQKSGLEFEKIWVSTRAGFLQALQGFKPDVILSDHSLPSFNSFEALQLLKETGPDIPFILVTSNVSEEFAVSVMKEGAFDYVLKDRLQRLPSAILNALSKFQSDAEKQVYLADLIQRNKDLEQFAYVVSHHLRAPVANIIGASRALNKAGLNSEDKEKLNAGINISVMKIDEVIKDLNRILQVKNDINKTKEVVRFSELVSDIKIAIRDLIDKNGIEIKHDFSVVNEFLTLKPYLYSIFFNLISNSIKYRRPQVHSIIEISSRLSGNTITLIFRDNGMGFDLNKRGDQVFGLYKRFHPNIEGKGVGLFMVKTHVESLGGKISVASEVDKGTEFKIEFKPQHE